MREEKKSHAMMRPMEKACPTCMPGHRPRDGETIPISGLNGGGLPTSTRRAELLEVVSPDWPKSTLIFCAPYKSALIEGQQAGCVSIASDYLLAYGFSWCGNSFAYATSSDVTIFTRIG